MKAFPFTCESAVEFFRVRIMCDFPVDSAEADGRIQLSSIKPETKEIWKTLKQ